MDKSEEYDLTMEEENLPDWRQQEEIEEMEWMEFYNEHCLSNSWKLWNGKIVQSKRF